MNPASPDRAFPVTTGSVDRAAADDPDGPGDVASRRQCGRRGFLGTLVALASAARMEGAAEASPPIAGRATGRFNVLDQKPWGNQTRRLKITRGGGPVGSLVFPTDYPTHFRLKPELHHVCTPAGVPVTGSHEYCFIHHMSVICGHGKVQVDGDDRVVDFYRQLNFPDAGRTDPHRPPGAAKNLYREGPSGLQHIAEARWRAADQVVIRLELAWQTREWGRADGDILAREVRHYRLFHQGLAHVMDVFSRLMPEKRPVTLLPENDHGYLGVRVHDLIDVDDGGVMRDSEGRDPSGYFRVAARSWTPKAGGPGTKTAAMAGGREPRWVDCTGKVAGRLAGMALMSHPCNVRNEWYAREFGLIILSGAQSGAVRITAEQPFEFAARYVAHDGPLVPAVMDGLHSDFSRVRPDELDRHLEG